MSEEEKYYAIALTRMTGFSQAAALRLYQTLGSAQAVYDHRDDMRDIVPDCSERLANALHDWSEALRRAAAEMEFASRQSIQVLTMNDDRYPSRLRECPDAPIVLYYKGTANLNTEHVVSIVGTRRATSYGQNLVRNLIRDMRQALPDVLIISGLAYGIDICAHRNALEQGYNTVAVLAHGLDQIYPHHHVADAQSMLTQGGLLTEYVSNSYIDKSNFVRRNRIVAGLSDATILVESAAKGGGLITCGIAQSYDRYVFAFPGAVGVASSEGCNNMIRDNGAALITSADDFLSLMGWHRVADKPQAIERQLFPELTDEERKVANVLSQTNDIQMGILSVKANIPAGQLTALLFQMEMKGVVRPMAGGIYHLMM